MTERIGTMRYLSMLGKLPEHGGGGPAYKTLSGPIVRFDDAIAAPLRSLKVAIEPVQEGAGDPSPENVRPITGRDGVTVTRMGKNLLPQVVANAITAYGLTLTPNSDGSITVAGTPTNKNTAVILSRTILSEGACKLKAGTYTVNRGSLAENDKLYLQVVPYSGTTMYSRNRPGTYVYSADISMRYLDIGINGNDGSPIQVTLYPQLELGSAATDYEAYRGETYAIAFPEEAGVVYGGVLDVMTGELTVTHGCLASYSGEALPGAWLSDRDVYTPGGTPSAGAQVVYELAEPLIYSLTPARILTLAGDNTLWADSGDAEATYLAAP